MALPTFTNGQILTGPNLTAGFAQEQQDTLAQVSASYLTQASAASIYLTQTAAAADYQTILGSATNIATVSALRTDLSGATLSVGQYIYLQGTTTNGDGGQGFFQIVNIGAYTDNNGTIFVGGALAALRIWDNTHGRPEWFGAIANGTTDCTTAINDCIVACPITVLSYGNYYCSGTINLMTDNRYIFGATFGTGGENGSYIITDSPTNNIVYVGLATVPASANNYLYGVGIKNVGVQRTVAVTPPASGSEFSSGASGVKIQWVTEGYFEEVYAVDNTIGWNIGAVDFCHFTRCYSGRVTNGSSATNDIYWAFGIDGTGTFIPESVYFTDCSGIANPTAQSTRIGMYSKGALSDIYFLRTEADNHDYMRYIDGNSQLCGDITIDGDVGALSAYAGLYVTSLGTSSFLKIRGGSITLDGTATNVGCYVFLASPSSAFSFVGNEGIGYNNADYPGLIVNGTGSFNSVGNIWNLLTQPIQLINAAETRINDTILNEATTSTYPAISVTSNSNNCVIECSIGGQNNTYASGISIDSTCTYIEARISGISTAAITGGAGNKLIYNATQITAAGAFGTSNLAQGIFG